MHYLFRRKLKLKNLERGQYLIILFYSFHLHKVLSTKRDVVGFQINPNSMQNWVKSVRIRSYSGPPFPAFGLNMESYSASLRI